MYNQLIRLFVCIWARTKSIVFVTSTLFLITACGLATPNDPSNETTDQTKPQIESVEPSSLIFQKVIDVNTTEIKIKFSESVEPDTIWENQISVEPAIDGTWTYIDTTRSVIFKRNGTSPLPFDTTYKLVVKNNINDIHGNPLEQNYVYTFSTATTFKLKGQIKGLVGKLKLSDKNDPSKQELSFDNDGTIPTKDFAFDRAFLSGDKYSLTLANDSNNTTFCSIEIPFGTVTNGDAKTEINCDRMAPAYSNAPNWNDFIKKTDFLSCEGSVGCFHGGESRSFLSSKATSCTNLSASDALDIFNWKCTEAAPGVKFTSSLKNTKGLRDLINFETLTWKKNKISIVDGSGLEIDSSLDTVWWNNPIVVYGSTDFSNFNSPSTVFIVKSNPGTLNIGSVKNIAILTDHGTTSSSEISQLILNGTDYLWVEAKLNPNNHFDTGITVKNSTYTEIRNTTVVSALKNGVYLETNYLVHLVNVVSSFNTGSGILLGANAKPLNGIDVIDVGMRLENVAAVNNGQNGIQIDSNGNSLRSVITASNKSNGLYITGGHNQIMESVTYNNLIDGLVIEGNSNNIVTSATSASNNGDGIKILDASSGTSIAVSNIVSNATITFNTGSGIKDTSGKGNNFRNIVSAFNTAGDCNAADTGQCSFVSQTPSPGDTNAYIGNFVGTITSASNPPTFNKVDFANPLSNRYRAWGGMSGAGACKLVTNGNELVCYERDFSLKGTSVLSNLNPSPSGTLSTLSLYNNAKTDYLDGAIEIAADGVGNDNGICEQNERCLYSPNRGNYQGHGNMVSVNTSSKPWESLGIKLYKYDVNGY